MGRRKEGLRFQESVYQYRGLETLPVHCSDYVQFIMDVLEEIRLVNPSRSELLDWLKKKSGLSRNSCRWYLHTLVALGLMEDAAKCMALTKTGNCFLETGDTEIIVNLLLDNFVGFREILVFLFKKKEAEIDDIHEMLEQKYHFGWKTFLQTQKRLRWMIAMNYAKKSEDTYVLTGRARSRVANF